MHPVSRPIRGAPEHALAWIRAGKRASLATVIATWGSAPRRVGAQMAVSSDGQMEGSVSGGCVEGAVVLEALEALEQGAPRLLEYGVSDGDAFAVGLACGGTIRVLVEPVGPGGMPQQMLEDLVAARAARVPVAYAVALDGTHRALVQDGHAERFRTDRSGLEEDGQTFIAIHNPPLRLIVVGAVHIAQALVPMARIAGFDPVVVDPREAFGAPARFPDAQVVNDWPDAALEAVVVDSRTALVLLTHDPKLDDPALHIGLRSGAFYIGALGSRRTHAARIERLGAAGFDPHTIGRIHGPVGLDIGAAGPSEIAVSILAQMIATLRKP
jgi:xanthine dehydrogenase accessory factor